MEFLAVDVLAALDESGQSLDSRFLQVAEGVEDMGRPHAGQRGEGFGQMQGFDGGGQPDACRGQDKARGQRQPGLLFAPAPGASAAGADPVQEMSRQQDADHGQCEQGGPQACAKDRGAPTTGIDIDAEDGDQFAGAGVFQGDESADPSAPAVGQGAFRGRQAPDKDALEEIRGFAIDLSRRGGVGGVIGFGIDQEEDMSIGGSAHQIDPLPIRIDLHRRHQLILEAAISGSGSIGKIAFEGLDQVGGDGLRHQECVAQQRFALQVVFPTDGPDGEGGSQEDEAQQSCRQAPEGGRRRLCRRFSRHMILRRMGSQVRSPNRFVIIMAFPFPGGN